MPKLIKINKIKNTTKTLSAVHKNFRLKLLLKTEQFYGFFYDDAPGKGEAFCGNSSNGYPKKHLSFLRGVSMIVEMFMLLQKKVRASILQDCHHAN